MAFVVHNRGRWFAVAYQGLDPNTGRDRRRWIGAADRAEAERIAADLPSVQRPVATRGGITVGRYLRARWLPAKKPALRPTTWSRYHKMTELYICPQLESVPLTSLATRHLEALYTRRCTPGEVTVGER